MITCGFGMKIEAGCVRKWYAGKDGVKRWADNDAPVSECTKRGELEIGNRKEGTGIYGKINKAAGVPHWCNQVMINEAMVEEMAEAGCSPIEIYDAARRELSDL